MFIQLMVSGQCGVSGVIVIQCVAGENSQEPGNAQDKIMVVTHAQEKLKSLWLATNIFAQVNFCDVRNFYNSHALSFFVSLMVRHGICN